jgi:hypothetical protein
MYQEKKYYTKMEWVSEITACKINVEEAIIIAEDLSELTESQASKTTKEFVTKLGFSFKEEKLPEVEPSETEEEIKPEQNF